MGKENKSVMKMRVFLEFNKWKLILGIGLLIAAYSVGTQRMECVDCTSNYLKNILFPSAGLLESSLLLFLVGLIIEITYLYFLACLIYWIFKKLKK